MLTTIGVATRQRQQVIWGASNPGPVGWVTSDAHSGLVDAVGVTLPGTGWQRCRTHFAANLMSATPKSSWPWFKALLHSVYGQPDAASIHAQFDRIVDSLTEKLPVVAQYLEEAREEILAFTLFPKACWRQIWSNNPNQRLNREIRRRTDAVGIFPDRDAVVRLVGDVLAEQHDEWVEQRRYLVLELLKQAEPPSTTPFDRKEEPDTILGAISALPPTRNHPRTSPQRT
jgi:putative transposase